MTQKYIFLTIYNTLATDAEILELVGLTSEPMTVIQDHIVKSREFDGEESLRPRLCIWEPPSKPFNSRVERRFIQVDIYVPRSLQNDSGVGYDISDRVKALLEGLRIGTGLSKEDDSSDDESAPKGWYKSPLKFGYNFIK